MVKAWKKVETRPDITVMKRFEPIVEKREGVGLYEEKTVAAWMESKDITRA
jgi:hypothetical protein